MFERSPRAMLYPYTLSAKVAQFPYGHYYKHSWAFRYGCYAILACVPLFWKITTLVNSPENKKKWREIREKQFSGEVHH